MKKFIPAMLIIFFACFMLFVYEPFILYANNINDFWFDFAILLKPILILFGSAFLVGIVLFGIVYFINKKFSKDLKVYNILLILAFIAFLSTYIQGNYLVGNLPSLDGREILWNSYKIDSIISILVWVVVGIIFLISSIKIKLEKTIRYATYVSIAVFAMLSVSLLSTVCTKNVFMKKSYEYLTNENINTISKNKNFFIFLVDAVDSATFNRVLEENEEYKEIFKDFTYYPDTTSVYPFTRDSIPLILTGKINKNEREFSDYSTDAYNNSSLFQQLEEKEYQLNLYEEDLIWNGTRNFKINNIISDKNPKIDIELFIRQELKYILFKYLPYPLKKYSKIEYMNFNLCVDKFRGENVELFTTMKENPILEKEEGNVFHFIHTNGAHVPYMYDKNLNFISQENGTYEQNVEATITLTKAYLERLKENEGYENSVIIIMADHGFDKEYENNLKRFNPLLLIKGEEENHDFIKSDIPITYFDLENAYTALLNGKKSTDLFKDIDKNRTRKMLWYKFTKEDHMVEYETEGTATDISKFKKTGNVYDR